MAAERQVIFELHLYQPPREANHSAFADVKTDPRGVNWTKVIAQECYDPLAQMGILKKVSFDVFGTLDIALRKISPQVVAEMEANMAKNGIADSYVHVLLPDCSMDDKQILIGAGYKRFEAITGKKPRFFWPPETAIDTATLEVVAGVGMEGFFCAPNQLVLNDGSSSNNMPVRIKLPSGRSTLAIPYDGELSHKLAFEDDPHDLLRADAYKFADRVVMPGLSRLTNGFPLTACVDGETFGHHMRWGGAFIDTLVNRTLPEYGVEVVSVNAVDFDQVTVAEGRAWDRSAWSCQHGGLDRWHGRCNCSGNNESWKPSFNTAFDILDRGISRLVARELGLQYVEIMTRDFDSAFRNPGPPLTTPELSLKSAKVSSLTTRTSCATFFGDPHVSGEINALHARVAMEHLKDAGLGVQAEVLWGAFMDLMEKVVDPTQPGQTGRHMVEKLLGDRSYC